MVPTKAPTSEEMAAGWAAAIHELRAPTFVINGFANMILERWDEGERSELLEMFNRLHRNAARLQDLVERLLIDARLDAASLSMTLHLEDTTLAAALGAGVDVAKAHGADIDISDAAPLTVHADSYRVEQIVTTLVDNACRHGTPPVEISASSTEHKVIILVHDQGPALPTEDVEHLFDRFSALGRGNGSNGLGLYTARRLARAMKGEVEYVPGAGATFAVSLPAGH